MKVAAQMDPPFLEHLGGAVGSLRGLISIQSCLREQGGPGRGRDGGTAGPWSAQNTHNVIDPVHHLIRARCTAPRSDYNRNVEYH